MPPAERTAPRLALEHALHWLLVTNLVGVALAVLLLWPELGAWIVPVSYGRLAPLHLGGGLYGWLALPLVALLLDRAGFAAATVTPRLAVAARSVVVGWSGCLLAAGLGYLAGESSGKLFLDWRGLPRVGFTLTLVALWVVLGLAVVTHGRRHRSWLAALGWLALAAVPPAWWWATSASTYPPIDPSTGGPTGGSLLGSTLGIVGLALLLPHLLGLERRPGPALSPRRLTVGFGLHVAVFLLVDLVLRPGDQSHHDPLEVLALASVLLWARPILAWLRAHRWPLASRPWLQAALGWGFWLAGSSIVTFLPGILDRFKFTNLLVAHAHLAMAGLATSLVAMLATVLMSGSEDRHRWFTDRLAWRAWHGGLLVQLVALAALGVAEGFDPGLVPRGAPLSVACYATRLIGGIAMATATWRWWRLARSGRSTSAIEHVVPRAGSARPAWSGSGRPHVALGIPAQRA